MDVLLHTLDLDKLTVCETRVSEKHNSACVYLTVLVVTKDGDSSS